MTNAAPHIPVMLNEIVAAMAMRDGDVGVDGTFGNGGYTSALLESANCRMIAIDRDISAQVKARVLQEKYGDRLVFIHGQFGNIHDLLPQAGFDTIDALVLDLGVSSMQIDQAERGFSFRFDGPLDMRMDATGGGITAADIVNECEETELADLIYQYGEERLSRRIARAIVEARKSERITRTTQLADIIRKVVPRSKKDTIDPATRTFQALRIVVNAELDELLSALNAAEVLLRSGGRLVIVTFHSLEDVIVKRFLQERSGKVSGASRHMPDLSFSTPPATFTLPFSKPVPPTAAESAANPRSRSAKMRVAIRTDARPWPVSCGGHA